jgi:hypothetical protein
MLDEFNWWENAFFEPFKKQQTIIRAAQKAGGLAALAKRYEKDLTRNTREEVNIYTYRTSATVGFLRGVATATSPCGLRSRTAGKPNRARIRTAS